MQKADFTVLRWAALFEGSSLLLLLFVTMPLKYFADFPLGVKIIGPIHGILFLSFITFLLLHTVKREINLMHTLTGFIAAFIPFGTFIFKAKLL